jgi:hypothetical protein
VAKKVGFRYFDEKEKTGIRHCLYAVCPGKKNGGIFRFFYEFIDYRFSFMHGIFFSAEQWFDILIQSLKFVPLMAAAILSAVSLYKDESK